MRVAIVCAGNHGRVIKTIIDSMENFDLVGFFDDSQELHGKRVDGALVLGKLNSENISKFKIESLVLGIGDNLVRAAFYHKAKELCLPLPNIIHPSSIISKNVSFGDAVVVMAGVIINNGTNIGSNVCINTGAQLDHDNDIGNHAHIYPGAVLGGCVKVGEYSHIGMNSSIRDHINIGVNTFVGMGSVVTKDVPSYVEAYGTPARIVKERDKIK